MRFCWLYKSRCFVSRIILLLFMLCYYFGDKKIQFLFQIQCHWKFYTLRTCWWFRDIILCYTYVLLRCFISKIISAKNCEIRTHCPLILCWLHICLLVPGQHCLTWLYQGWDNIDSKEGGAWSLSSKLHVFLGLINENKGSMIIFVTDFKLTFSCIML